MYILKKGEHILWNLTKQQGGAPSSGLSGSSWWVSVSGQKPFNENLAQQLTTSGQEKPADSFQ